MYTGRTCGVYTGRQTIPLTDGQVNVMNDHPSYIFNTFSNSN